MLEYDVELKAAAESSGKDYALLHAILHLDSEGLDLTEPNTKVLTERGPRFTSTAVQVIVMV